MPEKPLTIATYAAGASLAAITLVYVFGPTFFLDDEAAQSSRSSRKKGVVGLINPANDCFINSVLQTLAGLPELRIYLIRELHRRKLDGQNVYNFLATDNEEQDTDGGPNDQKKGSTVKLPEWKALGLQMGIVTAALKDVLDSLNERPIYKKTISAQTFVGSLENAFRTRISRQQQDAQEFLQIVTERLDDEYHAGRKARKRAKRLRASSMEGPNGTPNGEKDLTDSTANLGIAVSDQLAKNEEMMTSTMPAHQSGIHLEHMQSNGSTGAAPEVKLDTADEEPGFPFEGTIESQIECSHCHFKPKPQVSSFVTLTLNVPQQSSTSLNTCFDGMLKIEHIDDFKCDRCRLEHALEVKQRDLAKKDDNADDLRKDIQSIQHAINTDPETPPSGVKLPDISQAPKRRIARHMRISSFPQILAIHLSRSMWDSVSSKNLAKVSFPETLPLGGILDQVQYRLLGVVTHKGGHNSGHYESFRRQILKDPYSTPANLGNGGLYSTKGSPKQSVAPSPSLVANLSKEEITSEDHSGSPGPARSSSSFSLSSRSSQSAARSKPSRAQTTPVLPTEIETIPEGERPVLKKTESGRAKSMDLSRFRRKGRKGHNRWWRISDDKIKESKTSDVLGMQREVYLLFYELVGSDGE